MGITTITIDDELRYQLDEMKRLGKIQSISNYINNLLSQHLGESKNLEIQWKEIVERKKIIDAEQKKILKKMDEQFDIQYDKDKKDVEKKREDEQKLEQKKYEVTKKFFEKLKVSKHYKEFKTNPPSIDDTGLVSYYLKKFREEGIEIGYRQLIDIIELGLAKSKNKEGR